MFYLNFLKFLILLRFNDLENGSISIPIRLFENRILCRFWQL